MTLETSHNFKFSLTKRDLSSVEESVKSILKEKRLQKFNEKTQYFEEITVTKVTAEKTLKAALTLLSHKDKKSGKSNIDTNTVLLVTENLASICAAVTTADVNTIISTVSEKLPKSSDGNKTAENFRKITELLFQLKGHENYKIQRGCQHLFHSQVFYPRTFVRALQAIFLMDIDCNPLNDTLLFTESHFIEWCKSKNLDPDYIKKEYNNGISLTRCKFKDDVKEEYYDAVMVRLDIGYYNGVEFDINLPPNGKHNREEIENIKDYGNLGKHFRVTTMESVSKPYCAKNFIDNNATDILITNSGSAFNILSCLFKVNAISSITSNEVKLAQWEYLMLTCNSFHESLSNLDSEAPSVDQSEQIRSMIDSFVKSLQDLNLSVNPEVNIILAGGLFHDNYFNQALTVHLLYFLKQKGLHYSILHSNSDNGFIQSIIPNDSSEGARATSSTTENLPNSALQMHFGITTSTSKKMVINMIEECYENKVGSQRIATNRLTIFSSEITENNIIDFTKGKTKFPEMVVIDCSMEQYLKSLFEQVKPFTNMLTDPTPSILTIDDLVATCKGIEAKINSLKNHEKYIAMTDFRATEATSQEDGEIDEKKFEKIYAAILHYSMHHENYLFLAESESISMRQPEIFQVKRVVNPIIGSYPIEKRKVDKFGNLDFLDMEQEEFTCEAEESIIHTNAVLERANLESSSEKEGGLADLLNSLGSSSKTGTSEYTEAETRNKQEFKKWRENLLNLANKCLKKSSAEIGSLYKGKTKLEGKAAEEHVTKQGLHEAVWLIKSDIERFGVEFNESILDKCKNLIKALERLNTLVLKNDIKINNELEALNKAYPLLR